MFERFIILAKARKALRAGRLEEALRQASLPRVRGDRRAEDIRSAAAAGLLGRAQRRAEAGDLSLAVADLTELQKHREDAEAGALLEQLRKQATKRNSHAEQARQQLHEARQLAERGQLQAAEELAARNGGGPDPALDRLVAGRRQRAQEYLDAAAAHLGDGEVPAAVAEFRRALALDAGVESHWQKLPALLTATAKLLAKDVARHLSNGNAEAAIDAFRERCEAVPALATAEAMVAVGNQLAQGLRRALSQAEESAQARLARRVLAVEPAPAAEPWSALRVAAQNLVAVEELQARGAFGAMAERLDRAAKQLDCSALAKRAAAARRAATESDQDLAKARDLAAEGGLTQARTILVRIIEAQPMHEAARQELELIDQGASDREQRLRAAREAARAGRLREACVQALALAVPGTAGDDARLLVKDVRARMDLVAKGLDQVKAALHGPEAATAEGVQHCLSRLRELRRVQVDQEEIAALVPALEVEIEAIGECDRVQQDLAAGALAKAAGGIAALREKRASLWSADRLDARILGLADSLLRGAEAAVAGGRLDDADACVAALADLGFGGGGLVTRVDDLLAEANQRRQRAEALVAEARSRFEARDLEAAEELLQQAQQRWTGVPAGRRLAEELGSLQQQQQALARVEALAAERDFSGAHRKLDDLPPTPAALRTRIFDLKQELARAQGLEGAFLLRVDEGGEFLVLRGESVTVGNVRDGSTDLPILASLAGRHARIERTMSFHGGMEDRIVAQEGEIRVGGQVVPSHTLQSGDRVQLGRTMHLLYSVPSKRSLTASLTLLGGFQVAGTDRILLLKDRGRDGRILIGPAKDSHVRVQGAKGEIEVFTQKTGQVRVRCSGAGTIGGRPFTGEHPVDAGSLVQCAGVTFVLLPWNRGR